MVPPAEMAMFQQVMALRHHVLTELFVPATAFGSFPFALALIVGLYLLRDRKTAFLSTLGIVIAGGIGEALNLLLRRPRPDATYRLIEGTASGYGLPSGHTAIAFVLAIVIARQYPRLRWYAYTGAVLVAVSRVYLGMHYPLDVVGGAVLGLATGWLVLRWADTLIESFPFDLRSARSA